ncbi:MAG: integrin alpha, partial [Actinomycetota bacterium]|nr:integrin alpha [Actinomycetota bacterium]
MLVAITCALLGGPGAASALGATPATPYDFFRFSAIDPQTNGRFGDRMKDAGDIDGDGVGDVWIGVYDRDIGDLPNVGRVYALSGKNRSILYQIDSPEPQACSGLPFCGFGWSVSNLGDVDGDKVNDLVVGAVRHNTTAEGVACTPPAAGCNAQQGKAWVFSGAPGKQDTPLYALNNPQPQAFAAFGWASTAGDVVNAAGAPGKDGISEVLVGAFQNDFPAGCGGGPTAPVPAGCRKDQGQAFIFNGAPPSRLTGPRLVRTLDVPPEDRYTDPPAPDPNGKCESGVVPSTGAPAGPTGQRCGGLGIVNEGVGDVDGDGFWDQSVTAWTTGVRTTGPHPREACIGQLPPATGDPSCNERQGRIYIYSGANGSLLRKVDNPEPQQDALLGLQIVEAGAPGDVNGDGRADIYANGFQQHGDDFPGNPEANTVGQSWVLSGATGAVLYNL